MPNGFMWFDVTTSAGDVERVRDFYAELFDGPIGPDDGDGPYQAWMMDGERPWAAVVRSDDAPGSGRWLPYVHVEDLDDAVSRAVEAGATVVSGPTDGPAGTAVTISDPGGAQLALWIPFPAA